MNHNRVASYDPAIRRPPETASSTAADWQEQARMRGQQALHQFERMISEHPKACIGIGLAVGVFLGWLVKRR